ncbi:MAG: VOC family protein [Emcibacteraceae bacterium]|nr:VOC family protein [Emcibacteraceae bacterium]
MKKLFKFIMVISFTTLAACSENAPSEPEVSTMDEVTEAANDIIGNNAFLYYKDYDEAINYYHNILGFKNVFEFPGFAMILQFSPTTFITVVNDDGSGRGMHSADEAKTIAIALLTDQVDGWYDYAVSQNLDIRNPPKPIADTPHNGFLVTDPGGYILEFEYFAPHAENVDFMPLLDASENLYVEAGQESSRPAELGFKAGIYWLYHNDKEGTAKFYEEAFGLEKIVVQPFSDIYTSSPTGYIGLVEAGVGIHEWSHEKAVNVSFLTSNAQAWWDHLKKDDRFTFRHEELYHESDGDGNELIDIVIGYDPENYFIEIDQFLDVDANEALREALGQ